MQTPNVEHHGHAPPLGQIDLRFGSNAIRLGLGAWIITGAILLAFLGLMPVLWDHVVEPLPQVRDDRLAYRLSNDYWQFSRYAARTAEADAIPVLGDSVIWGDYVPPNATLTHFLNEMAGERRFANLGVDGAYPAALAGLVQYHGGAIRNQRLILHCNLLWMASPQSDLSDPSRDRFNHPALLPQFHGAIPGYQEATSRRIGIVIGRYVPFSGWTEHLKLAFYGGSDLPHWSMDHPYDNPLAPIRPGEVSAGEFTAHQEAAPWTERDLTPQDLPWMDVEDSVQWRFFRQTLQTLRERGNRVFVLVGPLNEHMLTPASRAAYAAMKRQVTGWLAAQDIRYYAPAPLPTNEYADLSHPLGPGYARLAWDLLDAMREPRPAGSSSAAPSATK